MRNLDPNPYQNLSHEDWWHPELPAGDPGSDLILSEAQVERCRKNGFVALTGLWPDDLIQKAAEEAKSHHPREQVVDNHGGFSRMPWVHHNKRFEMNSSSRDFALNHMTIHPNVLSAVAQVMGATPMELRLSQSHVIAKFGREIPDPNHPDKMIMAEDQDIHVDYGNNTLVVPPHTSRPDGIACLCYYSEVDECGGATHFSMPMPGELTTYAPDQFNAPNFVFGTRNGSAANDNGPRSEANTRRLYAEEKPIRYAPGTCIIYGLNAWHRGTPANLDQIRYTHHHVWRHKDAEWVNWQSLAPQMSAMPTRYLSELSVMQRTVLGFPAPGDRYWTKDTVDAVGQRYPEMDMTPYKSAAAATGLRPVSRS
ncbi:MAG: hypothetical protein CMQ05_13715 [Gammaproteobacteria bacterium]|nr:hypothetical protein [Gammaproteobacteria bacterium]RPG23866.1 MAG: hypothetical protein CBC10_013335 [Gammaproteobacteria bacterium TMED50]|tara:strand:+ start:8719 stop:9819 length:1101 start_codon:yes stop_codon:yes gene_type:complete